MAKQNFLNGGYIGKLGNTVGQRWKDKKIIRSYAKPSNPNTPAQQNARQQFAIANKLAQEAMVINGGQGGWDTSSKPEYSQRVGQAMRRLRLGYSEQDSLPLYPEGQAPALKIQLLNATYSTQSQSWTLTFNSFGYANPTSVEINFYTPLNYAVDQYVENTIHGSVDAATSSIKIDLSINNTQDSSATKILFGQAMSLGFCAMRMNFYDAINAYLPNVSIERRYAIANTLYDFDETLPIIETTDKVTFTQMFTSASVSGAITSQAAAGFPLVSKVSAEIEYFYGLPTETAYSAFIIQNADAPQIFPLPVTQANGYLQETTATTYTLTAGDLQPQIYKDSSSATYFPPMQAAVVTDIAVTGNTITLTFDQDVTAVGAASGEATIDYAWIATNGDFSPQSISGPITIGAGGTTATLTSASAKNIANGFFGSIKVNFKTAGNIPLTPLNNDPANNIAAKYYYSPLTTPSAMTVSTAMLSGKAIGGNVSGSFNITAGAPISPIVDILLALTYKDNTTEVVSAGNLYNFQGTSISISATVTSGSGKEITKMQYAVLAMQSNGASTDISMGTSVNTPVATINSTSASYSFDDEELTIQLPQSVPSYLVSVKGTAYSYHSKATGYKADTIPNKNIPTTKKLLWEGFLPSGDSIQYRIPLGVDAKLLYTDGTECTTTLLNLPLPTTVSADMAVQKSLLTETKLTNVTANTTNTNTVKLTVTPANSIDVTGPIINATWAFDDNGGDVITELDGETTTYTTSTVTFPVLQNYQTGTAIKVRSEDTVIFYGKSNGKVKLFAY